jgi:flagellin-like protein
MSEKNVNARGRRLRYLRRLRREKKRAVSPVVATLILILIAVAAAAALYLWLVAWQGGITKGIGSPGAQYTISIGGSTTVYPLDQVAIPWFEQNNTDVVVTNQPGGSGSGTIAACSGAIDIGASSSVWNSAQLAGDGCPASVVQTPVGYDGVIAIVSASNPTQVAAAADAGGFTSTEQYGGLSFNQSLLSAIYECNGDGTSYGSGTYTLPSWLAPTYHSSTNSCGGLAFTWSEIPQPAGCTLSMPCQYSTASNAKDPILLFHRADNSGTEQSFVSLLMGTTCGADQDNELASCGITNITGETGNPLLLTSVGASANGLGFNSYGIYESATNNGGAVLLSFAGPKQATPVTANAGSILLGVTDRCGNSGQPACTTSPAQYFGWRQLDYITVGSPTGESERFIQFVTGSSVNQELCLITGYLSIYSPGAPPPTPIVD